MRNKAPSGVPAYPANIYTADAIVDPYPHYARLRALGPVVWLDRQRVYALHADTFDIRRDTNRHSGSARAPMHARDRAWPASKRRRCCAQWSTVSTGSN